ARPHAARRPRVPGRARFRHPAEPGELASRRPGPVVAARPRYGDAGHRRDPDPSLRGPLVTDPQLRARRLRDLREQRTRAARGRPRLRRLRDADRHPRAHLRSVPARRSGLRGCALGVLWPLLVAAGPPAPMPPGGFAGGITGLPRALDVALGDVRGAGFDALRIFLRWDKIETVEGAPDWTCKYVTHADLGRDADRDGAPDPWPGIPCDGTPCGCGYSADERIAMAARDPHRLAVLLTIVGTPA